MSVSESVALFPLSYNQRAIWFIYQSAPESPAYNVSFSARISSDMDVGGLRHALQALVDRHSSLRTTYTYNTELLVQVHGYMECPFRIRIVSIG